QAPFSDGHALVGMYSGSNSRVKWTVIDKTGKNKMPLTTEWEPAHTIGFSEGLCAVFAVKDGVKIGYIDTNGKLVIPFTYPEAEPFKNGKAQVKLNGRSFYIDKNGQEIK
ncbi:MAG: WG repeat-containing protein, partial [Flavisolibacter sp.]|nr:WG repeat-containing protein [Flavisolibacter sp.]